MKFARETGILMRIGLFLPKARLAALLSAVLFLPSLTDGQTVAVEPAAADFGTVLVRRVALFTPPPERPAPREQRVVDKERARADRKRGIKKPASVPKKSDKPPKQSEKPTEPEEDDSATPEQLRILAENLLPDAVAERLRERMNVTVVPESRTRAAQVSLGLSTSEAMTQAGAAKLCRALNCEALLVPKVRRLALREGVLREIYLWAEVRVPYLRAAASLETLTEPSPGGEEEGSSSERAETERRRPNGGMFFPIPEFPISGATSAGRRLFRPEYARTRSGLTTDAIREAAMQAVHTLATGERALFAMEGERVAMAPVLAPTRADKLLFTAQGRRLVSEAVCDLPADVSARFLPSLAPLLPESQLDSRTMKPYPDLTSRLWTSRGLPDVRAAQEMGRRLRVDYILLARILSIELEEGPAEVPERLLPTGAQAQELPAETEREARAEAVGALVRVKDGAILWQERTNVTTTAHPPIPGVKSVPTDTQLAQDATRFALLQLERLFHRYRSGFTR